MSEHQGPVDETLTERPLESYLRDDERLVHTLTNREVGVERTDGDSERQRHPAADRGAVAALTDRRLLFAVGEQDEDFTASVSYIDVADAEATTETLTARLTVETATGTTWSFTAREADIASVDAFLTTACAGWGAVDTLESHCERLAEYLETGEYDAFDEHREAATTTLERARDSDAAARFEAVGDSIDRLADELYELVRDRYVLDGQEALASAETRLDGASFTTSYDRVQAACERFEHALSLAATHDIDTTPAADGLASARQRTGAVVAKPWAVARERAAQARDCEDLRERIERLEDALDSYQTLARLITGDQRPFSGDRATVRDESEAVIASLIDARRACARECRTTGNWEWEAGNDREAYEQFDAARADLDRAVELASAYPPGDAAALRERRASLVSTVDPLLARFEAGEANADD